jgi:hypothetical protein
MIPEDEGLYAVVCMDSRQYYLLDLGYSKNIMETFQKSPKRNCWEENKIGTISYAFYIDIEFNSETYMTALDDLKKMYKMSPCIE